MGAARPDARPYIVRLDERRGRVWIGTAGADAAYSPSPSIEPKVFRVTLP